MKHTPENEYQGHDKYGRYYSYGHTVKERAAFMAFLRSLGYLIEFEQGKIIAK